MKIKNIISEDLPPPENARKTQIPGTLPTYKKAAAMLAKTGVQGKALDFGAGLGLGTGELGQDAESYEPYPGEKFKPHFIDVTKIPDNAYHKIVNLNVLNVVPNAGDQRVRDAIVKNIGRVLAPGGVAIITTRGKDVLTIKGTPGEEPMSMISKIGTYQKGFSQTELKQYVQSILGDGFDVSSVKLGPAGVMIKKHTEQDVEETTGDPKFDKMLKGVTSKRAVAKQQKADTKQQARDAFGSMFGGGNPADQLSIRKKGVAEGTLNEAPRRVKVEVTDKGAVYVNDTRITGRDTKWGSHNIIARGDRISATAVPRWLAKNGFGDIKLDPRYAAEFGIPVEQGVAEATGDEKFDTMMGNLSDPSSLNTREAIALVDELMHDAGASYKEAIMQAAKSFDMSPKELHNLYKSHISMNEGENWSKHNNPRAGGMSTKSVKSYRRSHPGSKIQTAVTTKPSKLKKGSKAAKRRKSFCARMRGMKKHRTGAKTARDPNSNINKSLRRWNCESIEQMQELVMLAEQFIANHKK